MVQKKINNLWGAAFDESPSDLAVAFAAGRDIKDLKGADYYLLPYDIWLNRAHSVMLYETGIITKKDAQVILKGLSEIEKLASQNKFILDPKKEDVHTNIESWLVQKYGISSAGKLHTARSRNDQVPTDNRLYLKDRLVDFVIQVSQLIDILTNKAREHATTAMPGFTHHQHAMVTTFGHMLLAFVSMLLRDIDKFTATYKLVDRNILGVAAFAGTGFPIDREITTSLLGFEETEFNGLDGVTTRGEPEADFVYCISSLMSHLSILAETLIILSTTEFGMIVIPDAYSTGSSIMPQKKNPDSLEVIKSKTALVYGYLMGLLSINKGAFIGYNRDNQWSKYLGIDAVEECMLAPKIIAGIIENIAVNKETMERSTHKRFIGATNLVEYICVTYNIPFRLGKIIIEKAIKYTLNPDKIESGALKNAAEEEGITVGLSESELKHLQDPQTILRNYQSFGSPSLKSIEKMLKISSEKNQKNKAWIKKQQVNKNNTLKKLADEIKKILT